MFFISKDKFKLEWLNRITYTCFKSLFLRSNSLLGYLQLKGNSMIVTGDSLIGSATLWNVAFNAPDMGVKEEATGFLIEIYSSMNDSLKERLRDVSVSLATSALQYLEKRPTDPERLDRILRILQSFIVSYSPTR